MEQKIQQWAAILKAANEAATKVSNPKEDGGTCNFDTPVIDFAGWKEKNIMRLQEVSGISIGDKLTSRMWKGCRLIYTNLDGQGMNRTRMAEAAADHMKAEGLPAMMYYQMD